MIELMQRAIVIPVLTIERVGDAAPLARALAAGGLSVLEVTLRTPAALEAITAIAADVPEAVVGSGTCLTAADVERSAKAGAKFAVSPGLTPDILAADAIPLLPGVATASELMAGLQAGLSTFKFFPAVPAGGTAMLKAWAGPFADARFCPTGGIDVATAPEFLALPNVLCVGGGWVAPKPLIDAGDWAGITRLARSAAALAQRR
ncbi:bifunctional 4-hydroxy-2-oxoglutarate aldolase/2-dehydro-3-deoxy-phosphogluconate aldolase [Brevundimonas sp.]|uniref:bifunctional 4-hydroxy-2-oxoglutarate aldolase/2-dehydro-3-deoxy-phosphogluconate aldolase n=1 Tax=Brevundimonas sp. TaxID=1871086 RepID=UPI0025DF70E3|nr:bifunctional 4-hydroxy-2-oxoglutarate aldolase/2-dehydro-3-deoxy-phosphogluconate aldolase [Brevundimonas sp.]